MLVIGVTGRRFSGKSTISRMIAGGRPIVFDADGVCRDLYARDETLIGMIGARFPGSVKGGEVDRGLLSGLLLSLEDVRDLEALVHGKVRERLRIFLRRRMREGRSYVVLDVPLLFESGLDGLCDKILLVRTTRYEEERRRKYYSFPQDVAGIGGMLLKRRKRDIHVKVKSDKVLMTGLSFGCVMRDWSECRVLWGLG